jgi:hypothetical protein
MTRTYTITSRNGDVVDVTKPVKRYRFYKKYYDQFDTRFHELWDRDKKDKVSLRRDTEAARENASYYYGMMHATSQTVNEMLGGRRRQQFVKLAEGRK